MIRSIANLASFRRISRWLNLTLIHQGVWPLAVIVANAPATVPESTPLNWYLVRIAAPLLAALLAVGYLLQRPIDRPSELAIAPAPTDGSAWRTQIKVALIGLAIMLGAARLIAGPIAPAAKLLTFGAADVAAFQVIHFGVVARSWAGAAEGQAAAVILFGGSWALRAAFLAGLERGIGVEMVLAALGGGAAGLAIGGLSRLLRRWPGGAWAAAVTHWLLIYAILGFVE